MTAQIIKMPRRDISAAAIEKTEVKGTTPQWAAGAAADDYRNALATLARTVPLAELSAFGIFLTNEQLRVVYRLVGLEFREVQS